MPRNNELKKILLIGSGPIVIGQGCEFDYSGVQACKALREEGYKVVLVNSNPATIMTDPEFADRTYVEPIKPEVIEAIMEREKPDAILPTLGGQTALNAAMEIKSQWRAGAARSEINRRECAGDRKRRRPSIVQGSHVTHRPGGAAFWHSAFTLRILDRIVAEIGTFPLIIRPAFTLGGTGGGIAYNREELDEIAARGLDLSPVRGSVDRRIAGRLEKIRHGSDARPGGQLRRRLLDREFRSYGRARRRLHHCCDGPDPHRQGIPADA